MCVGCPAYVLDKKLADGRKLPRWSPRSDRGVYLGRADKYASSVYSILNTVSGSITPQYHIVMDDWFATVSSSPDMLPDFGSDEWQKLFGDSDLQFPVDDDDADLLHRLSASLEDSIDTTHVSDAQDKVIEAIHRRGVPPPLRYPKSATSLRPPVMREPVKVSSDPGFSPPSAKDLPPSWRERVLKDGVASRSDAPSGVTSLPGKIPSVPRVPIPAPMSAPTSSSPTAAPPAAPSSGPASMSLKPTVVLPVAPTRRSSRLALKNPR
jgi:hypothetical protein